MRLPKNTKIETDEKLRKLRAAVQPYERSKRNDEVMTSKIGQRRV